MGLPSDLVSHRKKQKQGLKNEGNEDSSSDSTIAPNELKKNST